MLRFFIAIKGIKGKLIFAESQTRLNETPILTIGE